MIFSCEETVDMDLATCTTEGQSYQKWPAIPPWGNNVTTVLLIYFVLRTYHPEETGLSEPTFSNSWAFAATLKNNFKI